MMVSKIIEMTASLLMSASEVEHYNYCCMNFRKNIQLTWSALESLED